MNQRTLEKIQNRKSEVATYNLDLKLVGDYWGLFGKRWYHHTGMVSTWSVPFPPLNIHDSVGMGWGGGPRDRGRGGGGGKVSESGFGGSHGAPQYYFGKWETGARG